MLTIEIYGLRASYDLLRQLSRKLPGLHAVYPECYIRIPRYALEEHRMAFHVQNPETDALARRVAALKKIGLTEAVHTVLAHELEREQGRPSLVDMGVQFCRDLRAKGNPQSGKPADKAFRDSLYEDD